MLPGKNELTEIKLSVDILEVLEISEVDSIIAIQYQVCWIKDMEVSRFSLRLSLSSFRYHGTIRGWNSSTSNRTFSSTLWARSTSRRFGSPRLVEAKYHQYFHSAKTASLFSRWFSSIRRRRKKLWPMTNPF